MLQSLSINNFVLIDNFNCQFEKGMTTITGESGHGKSIILDALSLLLGARCTQEYFRGDEKISLAAEFNIQENEIASEYLVEHGFDEDGSCMIRRVVTKEGSSKAFINSTPCTLSDLKKLGKFLIDIHTQNKNSEIFSSEAQMEIIDAYGKNIENRKKLISIFNEYTEKERNLRELLSTKESDRSRLELLNYKFKELKELDLKENEIGELEAEYKMLTSAEESILSCEKAQSFCSDEDNSIIALLQKIKNEISDLPLYNNNLSIGEMINDIEINANELFSSLGAEKSSYNIDEEI
jgi:DNA repair protein RecN (Recombination protein N)